MTANRFEFLSEVMKIFCYRVAAMVSQTCKIKKQLYKMLSFTVCETQIHMEKNASIYSISASLKVQVPQHPSVKCEMALDLRFTLLYLERTQFSQIGLFLLNLKNLLYSM